MSKPKTNSPSWTVEQMSRAAEITPEEFLNTVWLSYTALSSQWTPYLRAGDREVAAMDACRKVLAAVKSEASK